MKSRKWWEGSSNRVITQSEKENESRGRLLLIIYSSFQALDFDTFTCQPSIHFYIFYRKSKNTQSDNVSWAFSKGFVMPSIHLRASLRYIFLLLVGKHSV